MGGETADPGELETSKGRDGWRPRGTGRTMATVSARSLNILAALVWYVGGIVLLLKGGSLLGEAVSLQPGLLWPWIGVGIALLAGALKARFIFRRSCEKNLARIAALEQPRAWQFFKPQFFLFLVCMVSAGAAMSRLAHGRYPWLIAVAALDLALAVALLASSTVFWREKAFSNHPNSPGPEPA